MKKNRIAVKLSLYFAIALFVFSAIIGGIFIALFKSHTVALHKDQLLTRARSIASTLSGYMGNGYGMGRGMMGYGAYFRFIGEIAGTDVWIVDRDLNLVTSGMGHHGMMGGAGYRYTDLPENAESLIRDVFEGEIAFGEDFSGVFSESTLTVGVPIQGGSGGVVGVVLLHSPIHGVNKATAEGVRMLAISLGVALVIAFLLSLRLSKNFTDPIIVKEAQDALKLETIRREFIANLSHELKTPITVIRGSLEALVEEVVTDPSQIKDYHDQMLREATFLQRLVGDLLDLSKLQNAEFAIEKQDISLCDVLDDVVRSARHTAGKKGVTIHMSKDGEGCRMFGDYGRIRQMLMIILDNAVKFSREGSAVEIVLEDQVLLIRDDGPGIPLPEQPFIFDRFYKSRSEQNKTGTGLGLAIAKQIAERHAIELSVRSDGQSGATFAVKFHKNTK